MLFYRYADGCPAGETELGFLTAKNLSESGFTVFVAHKDLEDETRDRLLDLGPNVRPIQCDVIKYRDVTDAADRITRHCLCTANRAFLIHYPILVS